MSRIGAVPEAQTSFKRNPNSNSDLQALSESFDQTTEHSIPLIRRVGNPQNDVIIKGILKGGKSYNLPRDVKDNDDDLLTHRFMPQSNRGKDQHNEPTGQKKNKSLTSHDNRSIHSDRLSHQTDVNNDSIKKTSKNTISNLTLSSSNKLSHHSSSSNSHQKRDIIIPAPSRKYTTTNPGTLSPIYHLIYDLTSPTSPSSITVTTTTTSLPFSSSSIDHHHNIHHTTTAKIDETITASSYYKTTTSTSTTDSQNRHHNRYNQHQYKHDHHNQTNLTTGVNHVNIDQKIPVSQFLIRDGSTTTGMGHENTGPLLGKLEYHHPLPPLPPRSSSSSPSPLSSHLHNPSHFHNSNNTNININQRNSNHLNGRIEGHGNLDWDSNKGSDAPKISDIDTSVVGHKNGPHLLFHSQPIPSLRFNNVEDNVINIVDNIDSYNTPRRLDSSSCLSNLNTTDSRILPTLANCRDYRFNSNEETKSTGSGSRRHVGDIDGCVNNKDATLHKNNSEVNEVFTVSRNNVENAQKIEPLDATAKNSHSTRVTTNNINNNESNPPASLLRFSSNIAQGNNDKTFVLSDSTDHKKIIVDVVNGCDIGSDSTQIFGNRYVNKHTSNSICDKDLIQHGPHSTISIASGFIANDNSNSTAFLGLGVSGVVKSDGDFGVSNLKSVDVIKDQDNKAKDLGKFDNTICNRNGKRSVPNSTCNEINGDPKRAVFKREGDSVRLFLVQDQTDTHCVSSDVWEDITPGNNNQGVVISCADTAANKENSLISNKVKRKLSVLSPSGVVSKFNPKGKERTKGRNQKQRKARKKSDIKSNPENHLKGVGNPSNNVKKSPVNRWEKIHVNHTKHSVSSLSSEFETDRQLTLSSSSFAVEENKKFAQFLAQSSTAIPLQHQQQQQQQDVFLLTQSEDVTSQLVSDSKTENWKRGLQGCVNTNDSAPTSKPTIRGILVNKGSRSVLHGGGIGGGESGGGGIQNKYKSQHSSPKQTGVHFLDDTKISSTTHISHSIVKHLKNSDGVETNVLSVTSSPNTQLREVIDRSKYIINPKKSSSFLSKSFDDVLQVLDGSVTSSERNNTTITGHDINKKVVQNALSPRGDHKRTETQFIINDSNTILSSNRSAPLHSVTTATTTIISPHCTSLDADQQERSVGQSNKTNIASNTISNSRYTGRGSQLRGYEGLAHTSTVQLPQGHNVGHFLNIVRSEESVKQERFLQGVSTKRSGKIQGPDCNRIGSKTYTSGTFLDNFVSEDQKHCFAEGDGVNRSVDAVSQRHMLTTDAVDNNLTVNSDSKSFNINTDRSNLITGRYNQKRGEKEFFEDNETLNYTAQLKEAGKKSIFVSLYGADYQQQSGALECIGYGVRRHQERENNQDIPNTCLNSHDSHNSQDVTDSGLHAAGSRVNAIATNAGEKQLPPKITPRQKFEILHNRVPKKVATTLRHNNFDTQGSSNQIEHTDRDTQLKTSLNINECSVSRHDTLHHSTNSLYKESPRAKFERDRAARTHAVITTNTDVVFYHPCDINGSSNKFNKSCDDLDTSTFGYLKPTHNRNRSSETGTIPYLDAQYSVSPPPPTLPPKPAPRQSLQNQNLNNQLNQSSSCYTSNKRNTQDNIVNNSNNKHHETTFPNKLNDHFPSNSSNFNSNYSLSPKPILPPRSRNNSNIEKNNKDFTTGTFQTDVPPPVLYNTTRPHTESTEQRGHDNLNPPEPGLRSPHLSEATTSGVDLAVTDSRIKVGNRAEAETSEGSENKNYVKDLDKKEIERECRFLTASHSQQIQNASSLSVSLSAVCGIVPTTAPFANNNNIDISLPHSSCGVSTNGVTTTNRVSGEERQGISARRTSDNYSYCNDYTDSHFYFASSHQRVNEDLEQLHDIRIPLQANRESKVNSSVFCDDKERGLSERVRSVNNTCYDKRNQRSDRANIRNDPSSYSPSTSCSVNKSIQNNGNNNCTSHSVPCANGFGVVFNSSDTCQIVLDSGLTNQNNQQCACSLDTVKCSRHQKSCLEVPRLLKASATKKMSPDSVSSSGYESEHPISRATFTKEGKFTTANNITNRFDGNENNNNNESNINSRNNNTNNRSTVQELRLRFGHTQSISHKERSTNGENYNKFNQNKSDLKSVDRIVSRNISEDPHNILLSDDKYDVSTSPRPIGQNSIQLNNSELSITRNCNSNINQSSRSYNQGNRINNSPITPKDCLQKSDRDSAHSLPSSSLSSGSRSKQSSKYSCGYSQPNHKSLDKVSQSMHDIIHDLNIESGGLNKHKSDISNSQNLHLNHCSGLRNFLPHKVFTYQEAAMLASKGLRIYEDNGEYLLPIQQRTALAKTFSEPKVSWEAASYLIVPTVVESFNNCRNANESNSASSDLLQPSSVLDILTQRSISDSGATKDEINNGAHSDGEVCSDNEYIAMTRSPSSKMRARAMSVDLICKDTTLENSKDASKENILNPNVAKVSTRIKRKDRRPSRGYVEWKTCSGWIGGVDMKNMSKRNSRGYVEWDTIWTPASSTKGDGIEDEHVYDVIQDEQTTLTTTAATTSELTTTLSLGNDETNIIPQIVTSSEESDVPPALPERTYINKLKQSEETLNHHHRLCPRHSPHGHNHSPHHNHQQNQHGGHHHSHRSHRHHHRHSNSPSSNRRHHHHSSHHSHNHHHHHHHQHKGSVSSPSSSSSLSTTTSSKLKSANKPTPGERHPALPPPPPPLQHIPPPTHSPPPLPPPNPLPPHSSTSSILASTATTSTTTTENSQNYAQVSKLKGYTFGNHMTSQDSAHARMPPHHHQHHYHPQDKSSAIYSENYCHLQPLTSGERMTLWKPADVLDYIDGLHESMSPGRRENIYILLNNKKTRAKFSESLEIESRLLSKGLLGACISKLDIDATALSGNDDIGNLTADKSTGLACGASAAPEVKKRARVPVSSTYV